MIGATNILLLASDRVAGELAACSDNGASLIHRAGPYEALKELARERYDTMIVTDGHPDLPALFRAARRLRSPLRVYALCSPAGEADLRSAPDVPVDDYFIYPPSPQEAARMLAPPDLGVYEPVAETDEAPLPTAAVAALVEAAEDPAALAQKVAELAARWIDAKVRWTDACDAREDRQEPLLLLDDDPPRALVPEEPAKIDPNLRRRLRALQVLLGPLAVQARRMDALHRLAVTDHLTGAYNRRYFYHFTDQLLARAREERFRATLLLFDIDDFKHYNDTYGHAVGDEILREMTAVLKQITREHDVVARIGGDEFCVLFWDAEPPRRPDSRHPDDATIMAQRFADALATHEFPSLGPQATGVLTISGGLATFPWDGGNVRDLLRVADAALRRAKTTGKNAIYLVGPADRSKA